VVVLNSPGGRTSLMYEHRSVIALNFTYIILYIYTMMHVITACSTSPQIKFLETSAFISNLEINVLDIPVWSGYIDKIRTVYEFVKTLPDSDIVCFVDAFDVLAFADKDEIKAKFLSFGCNIVLSAELSAYPEKYVKEYIPFINDAPVKPATHYNYVNSGGYIGYVRALRELFSWRLPNEIEHICLDGGDQNYFTEYYLANANIQTKVQLDVSQTIFQCMNKVAISSFELQPSGRVFNKVLCQTPCFMHFNGFSAYSMQARSLETGECEDVREVFSSLAEQAQNEKRNIPVYYTVPFNIVYKGVLICDLPQL
jgi:hypothetical protein